MQRKWIASILKALLLLTGCGKGAGSDYEPEVEPEDLWPDPVMQGYSNVEITALNCGAADCFVFISETHVAIIDTGLDEYGPKLVDFLKGQGVTRVDDLIITHFDKDHVGGANYVIDNFDIGNVYVTYKSKDSDQIDEYMASMSAKNLTETLVSKEMSFDADGVNYHIYPPLKKEYEKKTSNNSSLVTMVTVGYSKMLLAGDAESERIDELLQIEDLKADILKMPHHGRNSENLREFIEYVSPEYAIITSSSEEPEDQEVMDALQELGVNTSLTRNGDIIMSISDVSIALAQ
jgi:beta-lactamase superfamily II metal-dependent hydrolase